MATHIIARTFPTKWVYGEYEEKILSNLSKQIDNRFPDQNNLILNFTWTGPWTHTEVENYVLTGKMIDQLFIVCTVDGYVPTLDPYIKRLQDTVGVSIIHWIGNFENSPFEFNFFAIVCRDHFKKYDTKDLILTEPIHPFVSYNRKPYPHRLEFVRELVSTGLHNHGVVTMGRGFPGEDHELYMSIGERDEDYIQHGHWYEPGTTSTPHEIPHDLFSLHNWPVWQHHFLHVIGATMFRDYLPVFVSQIHFKPIIGLRPFIINGQCKQSVYLRKHGFRTFEKWFPGTEINTSTDTGVEQSKNQLIWTLQNLIKLSPADMLDMYQSMLPDLLHNRRRWFEWADEQASLIENIFQ
jgi:hypothetical protein